MHRRLVADRPDRPRLPAMQGYSTTPGSGAVPGLALAASGTASACGPAGPASARLARSSPAKLDGQDSQCRLTGPLLGSARQRLAPGLDAGDSIRLPGWSTYLS